MNIIVIGVGEVGFHLSKKLSDEGHNISVIEYDQTRIGQVESLLDVQLLSGHGASADVLKLAEPKKVDLLLAVSNNDETNLLACYVGKQLGVKGAVARLKTPDLLKVRRFFYRNVLGIDLIISPELIASIEIMKVIRGHGAVAVENFAYGRVQMRRFRISEEHPWANKAIFDIKMPEKYLIAAILRENDLLIPGGNDTLLPDDHILTIGKTKDISELEKSMGLTQNEVKRVLIVGGGEVGFRVAKTLENLKMEVKLVDEDMYRCQFLSQCLPKTLVLHGDGTDLSLLKEERISQLDTFIAATGDDEKNIMSALLAKEVGAGKAIVVYNKPDYVPIGKRLGIDSGISPRLLATDKILKYIHRGQLHSIATIVEDKAEVVEMVVKEKSPVLDKRLSKAGFPAGSIVGAIVRDDEVFIPNGTYVLRKNDTAVIFALVSVLPKVEKLILTK